MCIITAQKLGFGIDLVRGVPQLKLRKAEKEGVASIK